NHGQIRPSIKTTAVFAVMRQMQKHGWNQADMDYWRSKGWTEKKRPWKKQGFMTIEIEYYKGDIFLLGKRRSQDQLQKELEEVEKIYNKNEDNFIELLCKKYVWVMIDKADDPEYTYDRDIGKLFFRKY
ncbi:MAG: hypothetical protein K2K41_02830, partial [Ruminiclostridium sp.]|nr:hypothetical protein [Ruminiclostridium sp.]